MQFVQKLDQIERRFEELTAQMADPAVISDGEQYRKIAKAHSELAEIVAKYREWKSVEDSSGAGARHAAGVRSRTARDGRRTKSRAWSRELAQIEEELKILLLPKDPTRRKERRARNPRRHRRRRSHAVRRRNLPHVLALRRNAALERGSDLQPANRRWAA